MRRIALILACLFVSVVALAREPGTAKGTITFNGKPKALTYAYAWKAPSDFNKNAIETVVLLSDAKIDDATLADRFAMIEQARKGKFTAVQVRFDPKGEIDGGTFFTAAEDGYFDASGMHKWVKKSMSPTAIEGKLSTEGEHHFFKTTFSYSADFKAPIGPAPKK